MNADVDGDRRSDSDSTSGSDERERPANAAPDAVKDPNEKTEGLPSAPQGGGGDANGDEADPGGG